MSIRLLGVCLGAVVVAAGAVPACAGVYAFPSADSDVAASFGFIDADEVGWFHSVTLGDRVEEAFSDPATDLTRVILALAVPSNDLVNDAIGWDVYVNDVRVGGFEVAAGFTGNFEVDLPFAPVAPEPGQTYRLALCVAEDVPFGGGAHTLAYAGSPDHSVTLLPEPATLGLVAFGLLALAARRRS